jgi:hypothetical protein
MKVMDLRSWPPELGGRLKGDESPQSTDEVTVESYLINDKGVIAFTCRFKERILIYRLFIERPRNADRFIRILYQSHGKSLTEIGELELTPHVVQI